MLPCEKEINEQINIVVLNVQWPYLKSFTLEHIQGRLLMEWTHEIACAQWPKLTFE